MWKRRDILSWGFNQSTQGGSKWGGRQIVPPEHTWAITSILTNVFKARQKKRRVNESENWGDGSCVPLSPDKPNITTSDDVYTRLKKRDSWRWPGILRETRKHIHSLCNTAIAAHLAKVLELLNRVLLAIPNSNTSKCTTTKHCVFVLICGAS